MSEKLFDDLNTFNSLAKDIISDWSKNGIAKRVDPKSLLNKFGIELSNTGISENHLIETLKELALYTPKTSGKLFFNQLFGGLNSKAVLGDLLAVILNNSMATYKIAGPMIEIEREIIRKVAKLISYPDTFGGTIPTGGSMSNFMAIIIARDKKRPATIEDGNTENMVFYTSESSHYSMGKNASFSGIGKNNVKYIETNEKGEMISKKLNETIQSDLKKGLIPFLVNATIGSTVMGANDPINEISKICKKFNLWLHLDGAFGGSIIFSKKYKHLVNGIQHSDSFCFNPHKTLGTPLSTSVFIVKNKQDLFNSFNQKADYLYQTEDNDYNLGQMSFECGRRNNALKFWTLWKYNGTDGISKMVDHNYSLADFARNYITNDPDYKLYSYENSLSICFNYKNIDPKILCNELYNHNQLMVGYGSHKNNEFVRLVSINRENTKNDILNFFKVLEKFVEDNF